MAARPLVVNTLNCRFSILEILGARTSLKLAQPKTGPRGKCERVETGAPPSTVWVVLELDKSKRAYLSGLAGALAGAVAAAAGTSPGLLVALGSVETGVVSGSLHLPAATNWLRKSAWLKPKPMALWA